MEQLSEKLYDLLARIPKSYYVPIGLAVAGVIFLGIGLMQLSSSQAVSDATPVGTENTQATTSANSTFGLMKVDVEGAVVSPGVYSLPNNARAQDALIAAGGLSQEADRDTVAKSLNLAAKLTDGMKIYVPKIGENTQTNIGGGVGTAVLGSQTSLININTASADQLDSLPGIGPVTAQKIISARPFSSVDDLLSKKALSNSVFQKIKDSITIY